MPSGDIRLLMYVLFAELFCVFSYSLEVVGLCLYLWYAHCLRRVMRFTSVVIQGWCELVVVNVWGRIVQVNGFVLWMELLILDIKAIFG